MRETFQELQVLTRDHETAIVLQVHGEIDLATVGVVRESLRTAVERGNGDVELDLSATRFCDSVGLCALAEAHHLLEPSGRALRVVAASPLIRRLLDVAGMAAVFGLPGSSTSSDSCGTPHHAV